MRSSTLTQTQFTTVMRQMTLQLSNQAKLLPKKDAIRLYALSLFLFH